MPDLSPEAEQQLAARIAAGDRAARDEIICRHRWVVDRLARFHRGWHHADAVGDGTVELVHCANRFRPGQGTFADFCKAPIRRAMNRGWRRRQRERGFCGLDDLPEYRLAEPPEREQPDIAVAMATALTEAERAAIRRKYGVGAERRRVSERTGLVGRAERKLRDAIEQKGA